MTFEDVRRIRQDPSFFDCDNEELGKMIDEAVEKQIQKKPEDDGVLCFCPACKSSVWYPCNYCEICGQKIDWSGR